MAPFYQILPLTLPDINKGSICSLNLEEKYIIAGYVQKPSLRIWNPNAGLCVKTFKNGESKDVATLFNKTNEYIVSSSSSVEDLGKIHLYKKGKKDKDWVEECFYGANKAFIFTDADRFVTAGRGGRDYFSSVVKSVSINDKYIAGAFEDSSVKLFKYNKQTGTKCTSGFYKVLYPNKYHDESLTPANIENIKAAQEQNFKTEKNILSIVELFDVYEGDKLPKGKKSYGVSFYFQDPKKTLTDKYVDKIMGKLQQQFESQLGAQLR